MSATEYVEALYQLCLGRKPDQAGLTSWLETLDRSHDPTSVLRGILESPEFARRASIQESGFIDSESLRPVISGPLERLSVHPTVQLNDALINTVSGNVRIDEHAFLHEIEQPFGKTGRQVGFKTEAAFARLFAQAPGMCYVALPFRGGPPVLFRFFGHTASCVSALR